MPGQRAFLICLQRVPRSEVGVRELLAFVVGCGRGHLLTIAVAELLAFPVEVQLDCAETCESRLRDRISRHRSTFDAR